MPFQPKRVFVEFSPTRQELCILGARGVVASRSERTDPIENPRRWTDSLGQLEQRLAGWARELRVAGAQAVVVYSSPDVVAHVFACAAGAGAARARQAAELALDEAVPFDVLTNAHDTAFLWRDTLSSAAADGSPRPPQLHHLATADTGANCAALTAAVRAAGLQAAALVPLPAVAIAAAVADLGARAAAGGAHAVLWIGEHHSVLAAGSTERLFLLRLLPLGTESLVEALARPMKSGDGRTQCVLLDRTSARRLVWSQGIPWAQAESAPDDALDPSLTLPLLQPVLQKLSLEVKHSLRFGLGVDERDDLRLHISGPGASVRGIGRLLSESGIDAPEPAPQEASDPTALLRAAQGVGIDLLPARARAALQARRMRRALWAGIGAAALGVGVDAFLAVSATRRTEPLLARLTREESLPEPSRDALRKAVALDQSIVGVQQRLGYAFADVPEWSAVFGHVADATPEDVRLASIVAGTDEGQWTCRLAGVATSGTEPASVELVRAYVQRLAAVPGVAQARLGATHRSRTDTEQLSFEITLTLVGLPRAQTPVLHPGGAGLASTPPEGDR